MESKQDLKKSISAPKNFLVPLMLLHLREFNAHGYELMEKISQFGLDSLDRGNFYRLLRQLEKDDLVSSFWDTSSDGPAKRIYSITDAGEQYLDMWAGSLSQYQKLLNQFFNLYNPFYTTSKSSSKKKVETIENENVLSDEKNDSSAKRSVSSTKRNVSRGRKKVQQDTELETVLDEKL